MRFVPALVPLALLAGVVVAGVAGCGGSGSKAAPPTTAPTATAAPPTAPPSTTPSTSLSVTGVSPGVEQAPFYASTTVAAVSCGSSPDGPFVLISIPPGGSTRSALSAPTSVVVVPNKAELKDHAGKVLYEQDQQGIPTGPQGAFVLSLNSVTYLGGDGRAVPQGAMNISGNYACPAATVPFPGL